MSKQSSLQPQNGNRGAVVAAAALATVGIAIGAGKFSEKRIPDGSIGLKDTPSHLETAPKVEAIESGNYLFGALRFSDVRILPLGKELRSQFSATLTPGSIDKLVVAGQKSLVARSLPVLGEKLKSASADHLKVQYSISYRLPDRERLSKFLGAVSSSDFEEDFQRIAAAELKKREDALGRKRWFKPDMEELNATIASEIASVMGVEAEFKIEKIEKFTTKDRDFAAERDKTREARDSVVEVLFDAATFVILR